ncbi:MAG: biotin/lipoate A/B protein ligase family protein [bacterium]
MDDETRVWRFLDTGANDGAFNMATDAALARLGQNRPVLRTYTWCPPTISIGFHQRLSEIDKNKCQLRGIDIVRRPTGGRAIYHAHEVTYCVVVPKNDELYNKSTLEVYDIISSALVQGLRRLDIDLALEKVQQDDADFANTPSKSACFATSAQYEIHVQSRKLVGSAQRRFKNGLLQHGSIMLGDDHMHLTDYLTPSCEAPTSTAHGFYHLQKELSGKTISVERVLARTVRYEEVVSSLHAGFQQVFGVRLCPDRLTERELRRINELIPKYSNLGGNHES